MKVCLPVYQEWDIAPRDPAGVTLYTYCFSQSPQVQKASTVCPPHPDTWVCTYPWKDFNNLVEVSGAENWGSAQQEWA